DPLILGIDILLGAYHAPNNRDTQKQKILILIIYYCAEWLMEEGEKGDSSRRPHVQALVGAVEGELRSPAMKAAIDSRLGVASPGKTLHDVLAQCELEDCLRGSSRLQGLWRPLNTF